MKKPSSFICHENLASCSHSTVGKDSRDGAEGKEENELKDGMFFSGIVHSALATMLLSTLLYNYF